MLETSSPKMSTENFNPSDPKYKRVEDLPKEERGNFRNVKGGFAAGTAKDLENISLEEIQQEKKEASVDTEKLADDILVGLTGIGIGTPAEDAQEIQGLNAENEDAISTLTNEEKLATLKSVIIGLFNYPEETKQDLLGVDVRTFSRILVGVGEDNVRRIAEELEVEDPERFNTLRQQIKKYNFDVFPCERGIQWLNLEQGLPPERKRIPS